jgi:hypothetical protein
MRFLLTLVDRNLSQIADETIYARVSECRLLAEKDSSDPVRFHVQMLAEHRLSWGLRGDNNPGYAKYLGYLTSKELYPDFEPIAFRDYLTTVISGTAKVVYTDDRSAVAKFATALSQGGGTSLS